MQDGTESKAVSPRSAEVCDSHTLVTLCDLLAPFQQRLTWIHQGHNLDLNTEKINITMVKINIIKRSIADPITSISLVGNEWAVELPWTSMTSAAALRLLRTGTVGSILAFSEASSWLADEELEMETSSGKEALKRFFTRGIGTGKLEESSAASCLDRRNKRNIKQNCWFLH